MTLSEKWATAIARLTSEQKLRLSQCPEYKRLEAWALCEGWYVTVAMYIKFIALYKRLFK